MLIKVSSATIEQIEFFLSIAHELHVIEKVQGM